MTNSPKLNLMRTILNWTDSKMKHRKRLPNHYERVYILKSALQVMAAESERMPGLETGGVLVGFVDSSLKAAVVTAVSGPGPKAEHGPYTFNRDRAFCQAFLDEHAAHTGGVVDFVGEWHKHREMDPLPSLVDISTYRKLAANPDCHLDLPLVFITGMEVLSKSPPIERFVRAKAFVFRRDGFVSRCLMTLPDEAYVDLSLSRPAYSSNVPFSSPSR